MLSNNDCSWTVSFSEYIQLFCEVVEQRVVNINAAMEELREEEEEGEEEGSSTKKLASAAKQVPKLQVTLYVVPIYWAMYPSG